MKDLVNERIASHEVLLMTPLLKFLQSRKSEGLRILGIEEGDSSLRAPTISFVVDGKSSKMIAESFDVKKVVSLICS
jgi:selenocysteine lyase/cysteine desulfurase